MSDRSSESWKEMKKENSTENLIELYNNLNMATSPLDFVEESHEKMVFESILNKSNCLITPTPTERKKLIYLLDI